MGHEDCILVTGGAGYIGSHVCKALARKGYTPVTLDNLSVGRPWAVKWGPLVEGDITDAALLDQLCSTYSFKGAFHLAGLTDVRESNRLPLPYYHSNVTGSLTVLEALKKHQVPHFIFSSTCAVYGLPQEIPVDETHPKAPISVYGTTKWMVEQMSESVSQAHGMHVAALRYFNAAGADVEGEIGKSRDLATHLIPIVIQTALKKHPHFNLNGSDHSTPDGTPVRDYIHVNDLAEAHVKALEWMRENRQNLALNLGTGHGYSVQEVLRSVEREFGCKIPIKERDRFPEDPPMLVANASKAQSLLNWKPKYSDLETIIQSESRWQKAL